MIILPNDNLSILEYVKKEPEIVSRIIEEHNSSHKRLIPKIDNLISKLQDIKDLLQNTI